jgi:predicted Zn-dependent protease
MRSRISLVVLAFLSAGCATTPYTNRKQLILVPESQESALGLQAYQETLKQSKISQDSQINAQIKRVGDRIAQAANKPDYQWQFTVIDDPKTINAFCLPGGKVAVYTGILPLTQDDNGLAVVLSHEVAHALARHGAERMSEGLIVEGAETAAVAGGVIKSEAALQGIQMAYGVGRSLPFSRKQESEADHIGLILMAQAGFDPRSAVDFWTRMASAMQGKAPPEFLSDHPSDKKRIDSIREELPEAMSYYHPK